MRARPTQNNSSCYTHKRKKKMNCNLNCNYILTSVVARSCCILLLQIYQQTEAGCSNFQQVQLTPLNRIIITDRLNLLHLNASEQCSWVACNKPDYHICSGSGVRYVCDQMLEPSRDAAALWNLHRCETERVISLQLRIAIEIKRFLERSRQGISHISR